MFQSVVDKTAVFWVMTPCWFVTG